MGCAQIIHGASKLGRVALGINRASEVVITARRDICRACPFSGRNPDQKYVANKGLTSFSRCDKCGCFIAAKTTLASEKCPIDKW